MNTKLWQPIRVGDIRLNHRLAMAPMTRSRSTAQGVPTDLNAEYYAQRASMALIISEGTQPSDDGQGYLFSPGIYKVIGWRKVTEAVRCRSRTGRMAVGGGPWGQTFSEYSISRPERAKKSLNLNTRGGPGFGCVHRVRGWCGAFRRSLLLQFPVGSRDRTDRSPVRHIFSEFRGAIMEPFNSAP
jgi:NADH:flavin oxidoreductase / NADH oxidase family